MKGKGKKERDSEDECPLLFIDFKSIDFKDCPRLSSILSRKDEKTIALKDLDCLQLELESLLTSVISRKNQLENEMEALSNWQDTKTKDKKVNTKSETSSGKRSNQLDASTSKKFKESHSSSSTSTSSHYSSSQGSSSNSGKSQGSIRSKSKDVKAQDFFDTFNDPLAIPSNSTRIRNDLPEKFWKFVEPYCSSVKTDAIKYLEEILKQCEIDHDLLKIPSLEKNNHKWDHDSWDSKNESSKSNSSSLEKKKGLSPYNSSTPGEKGSKKSKDSRNDPDKVCFGILTQRLVSCLIEENLSRNEDGLDTDHELNEKLPNGSNINLFKSLNFGNTNALEKRLKKELEEQGLLDPDDGGLMGETLDEESDEILSELFKCQNELKIISAKNVATIKYLLEMAKKDIVKQEWETKLKTADSEVMDTYRKILSAKQKKRVTSKKEREAAIKALKDREIILKEIDSLK